ncbi:HIT domain-containing protein [Candidatus Falkowbacteria bacterium]|nr:HIT domain-containing protein [Candidatus Falkowbacteria bacterium]
MECMFCDKKVLGKEEVMRNATCIFLSSNGYNPEGVLEGAGVIIPFAHKATPFDLSDEEVLDMFNLLKEVRKYLDEKYGPSGYTIGWNVGKVSGQIEPHHVHLHVMPRYDDEPLAGKGIRNFLKQKSNSRIKAVRES